MKLFTIAKDIISPMIVRLEKFAGINPPLVSVLCYHSISSDNSLVDVTREQFISHLEYLEKKFEFITLEDVTGYIKGDKIISRPSVAITFDDGYKDLVDIVLPILETRNIPAAVFVLAEPEKANRNILGNIKPLMNSEEMIYLQNKGWTIGCHAATHKELTNIDNEALEHEIVKAKKIIEEKLGRPVKFLAYPQGLYDQKTVEASQRAGYLGALTTDAGFISTKTLMLQIPRVCVDRTHTLTQFRALLTKSSVRYFQIKKKIGIKN